MHEALKRLQNGSHHDPFELLGYHETESGGALIRALLPHAEQVELDGIGEMERVEGSDLFELHSDTRFVPGHYTLKWQDKAAGNWHKTVSPYSFEPQVGELDMHWFGEGNHHHVWHFLGSRITTIDDVEGVQFAVWAPDVTRVSVVGDFNAWDGRRHPMRCRGGSGIWELFIPGLTAGDAYKYEILSRRNDVIIKADPYGRHMSNRPETTSLVPAEVAYEWQDHEWMSRRKTFDWQTAPMAVYEMHAGSWQRSEDGTFLNWRELAERLVPYVVELGYTHIELLPVSEHPLDASWGYQVSGYYAPTARFGTPDDFRFFVDAAHKVGIGILLDWVPAHFPKDDFALARFTGEPVYEHADPRRGEHRDWGTLIFDYGRNEVRNFLIANAVYWLEEFHLDGLRVDAVASMLYHDYSREDGDWLPNVHGGRENLEAIHFLQELNRVVLGRFPGAVTIAEESTSWPMVSRPVELGGLGFSMKWNMGWMNDSLSYIEEDPVYRKYNHNLLTFSQLYAFTENFVLPLSHDEVVHGKRSMVDKMPGDYWQKMANLRLFYAWQYGHPGKKLLFMGCEFAQWHEWSEEGEIDWGLNEIEAHAGIRRIVGDLNRLYCGEPAMHQRDFTEDGFRWIDCHDSEQSVLSFIRYAHDAAPIICVFNFTPVPRYDYRLGIPHAESYHEVLNSDSTHYGGTNTGNGGDIQVQDINWMGFEQSISVTLPPLGALFLRGT
ncbi:1,4-alpha-glucan branching enzyme [Solemya velum gill symbiont]|uniref:1,4-alpha-glucan branching protein GlgB n=1 Tax=Solemya velum gill symbiont TaxID=2340 RepID=UPI0009967BCC|nr:1,4-alpha-glucan branching protein GlgB [Solemya velum gill symbiont]OOZ43770.1 1,4-alpha-glucan branching enzyme [Solemya velum gill symbiont]OOZ47444.1 1,4-alpha-glucan branching enzyme [Solemya velum gill symbiont]OOZ49913.1 1,4-alpha-glucan branching enzyme [Solemya velum gill symbiont]OOZ51650.1 1,4-alpha-glucan branching enzyme [Solemya velum gill symbiont]OOZ55553.1 1,4-alpha-glucan branching enzyme [Solemya velum gill symbiont]